jgi:hypothetical protein
MIGSGAGQPQANFRTLLNLLLQVRQKVEACRVGTVLKSVVAEPDFAVSIQRRFPGAICLCGFVAPIHPEQKWVSKHVPKVLLFQPASDLAVDMTGSVANRHML